MKTKLYKTLIITLFIITGYKSHAQLYVSGGGSDNLFISNSGLLYVNGNVTNNGTVKNQGSIELTGNISNDGTTAYDGGTLTFKGSSQQSISGTSLLKTNNMVINNSAGIQLNNSISADGIVTFTNGIVGASSASNFLEFTQNSSYLTPSAVSHVSGYVKRLGTGSFRFPLGDGIRFQPVKIDLTANNSGVLGSYSPTDGGSGTFVNTGTETIYLSEYNTNEHWVLEPVTTAEGTVTVFWDDYKSLSFTDLDRVKIAHKESTAWANEGGTGTGDTLNGEVTSNSLQTFGVFTLGLKETLSVSITSVDVLCNGGANGSATANVSGGTAPHTYLWSNGATTATTTGLAAGTYTVTVTDANGASVQEQVIITQPASPLTATAGAQTNVSCNSGANGAATVAVSGGTPGYTYSWAPSGGTGATATGLSAGVYTVTVTDANGCIATQSFTITQPALLTATAGAQTNVSCNSGSNGSATVNVTGGTPGYTYSWAPSGGTAATATGLTAGVYMVTVTDANGCIATQSFTITQPAPLTATAGAQNNVSCNGGFNGSATVNVTGGTPGYSYLWAPSGGTAATATGLTAGTYTVTVTDANGCIANQSFTITQPASPLTATAGAQTNVSCNSGANGSATVAVTGGTAGYTYSWGPSGGTGATATGLSAGVYTVTVTDANGCIALQSFTITQPAPLTVTAGAQTNVSCNSGSNGSATVSVTGGTPGYTYSWAPSGGTAATANGLSAGTYTVTVTDANGCIATQSFTITQPALLNATAGSQSNVSCNGGTNGSATVNVTGGTPGYTYSWVPSGGTAATATGLSAGTYTVTVTDANGCTATKSFTITQPTLLNATAGAQTNVSCNSGANGSATVSVSGGTPGYTYSWAPSGGTAATATGLSAGTYTVTVTDANGCIATRSFNITQPTLLNATAGTQTNVSCNGGANGSATVAVSGGTPGYTYSWAPSGGTAATATGLSAGTYTVTVTDANGCMATKSFTVTQPTLLNATAGTQTNVSCNGGANGSATVAVSGGTPGYTYSWAPSGGTAATANGLSAGTYTVTVTDANGCIDTQSFTISQPALLNATAGSQTNVSCNGGANGSATVAVSGGTPGYTYTWAPSGGTAATATGLSAGTYTVTVTDANGCTDNQSFIITQPASALTATSGAQTNVSCNGGANGSAAVNVSGGTPGYTYAWSPSGGTAATATGLSAGTYTVTVTDANGCVTTQSFTITQPAPLTATVAQDFPATCAENSDGGATITVTGGVLPYAYVWDNGETTASAETLSVGNHTVMVTDANSCTLTATVAVGFEDTQAPEPAVAALPDIIAQCLVTQSDVPVPAATDNCLGSILVTTDTVFPITAQGTTVITWAFEDVNGNTTTQTQNVVITDTIAPVPAVSNLPAITMQCQVLESDIPVPIATDNCAGTLLASTTDPLLYTAEGDYVITWRYDDGNGNITTQTQIITVTGSAIDAVTFAGQNFVYNTAAQAISVENLPTGATVDYTISPDTGLGNAAINAGTYTVTALVNPAPDAPNCSPVVLTATLTIEKAEQLISFDPLPVKNLETDPDFQLTAAASSGLEVNYTYTFTSPATPATVTSQGWVDMLTSGVIAITAYQDGDSNYLPATPVTQQLVINSSDASIHNITIGDVAYDNPGQEIYHLMVCEEAAESVTVNLLTEANASVVPGHTFVIQTPEPGIYTQAITVTSQDGNLTQTFTVTVEKMFPFYDIVEQKFDNLLLANNNPSTNGGYSFAAYEWYKNGMLVGREQYFSEGPTNGDMLDPNAEYYLKLTTVEGEELQTCIGQITLEHSFSISVLPNPVVTGSKITITADFPTKELNDMRIDIHDLNGRLIHSGLTSQRVTEVQLASGIEEGVYIVSCTTSKHRKSFKIIVRK
ncbi:T9SS type A sorting domain-containing protein [Flavobacterium sp. AG291]|uniref:T9SS type A sorting domain-containing protein n=1 Tax=Flavobacterium sp. AG291 TaxID=2184000 RepID=UPI000E0B69E4|nr:T9SS type A sorting domain-containing protein [Flavobacterium sp. AG291]RDI11238.1 putative secreted protein (Por secretion system target) [Flavobacterium sp. AG291]